MTYIKRANKQELTKALLAKSFWWEICQSIPPPKINAIRYFRSHRFSIVNINTTNVTLVNIQYKHINTYCALLYLMIYLIVYNSTIRERYGCGMNTLSTIDHFCKTILQHISCDKVLLTSRPHKICVVSKWWYCCHKHQRVTSSFMIRPNIHCCLGQG